jgi:hypothetical protein
LGAVSTSPGGSNQDRQQQAGVDRRSMPAILVKGKASGRLKSSMRRRRHADPWTSIEDGQPSPRKQSRNKNLQTGNTDEKKQERNRFAATGFIDPIHSSLPTRKRSMKKSLLSALGLAVALAFTAPVIGTTSADAAPMVKHHRHHRHHRHHHRHPIHHHHHHHHMKKMVKKV